MRNFGSGALQLAHVEAVAHGFVELQLSIWDAIGGALLVDEAGGRTRPFPRPSGRRVPAKNAGPRQRAGVGAPSRVVVAVSYGLREIAGVGGPMPPGSTYLRNAAFACSTVTASIARSISAEIAHVRPRKACDTASGQRVVLRTRVRRSSSSAFFASPTSCSVNPPSARA